MPTSASLSVVMPLYNNAEHFSSAIESILQQTFTAFELIIIDDGSQDCSPTLLRSYASKDGRIRPIFLRKNIGVACVLQMGLEKARAPLVARMDADDFSLPQRFERQTDFMKRHPEVGMVGCSYFRFRQHPDHKRQNIRLRSLTRLSSRSVSYRTAALTMCHASAVYRRELALGIGGYRAFFRHGAEDRDFGLRLQEKAPIVNLPDLLYGYRKNSSSTFVQRKEALYAAHLVAHLCTLMRRDGFSDPIDAVSSLSCLPQELGLESLVTLEDLQQNPRWAAALVWAWVKKKSIWQRTSWTLYARLLEGCLRSQIGLASLRETVAALDVAARLRS